MEVFFFFPFSPPPFITHFTFSKKFGLINYSGGNYNPLVLLQSSSEELRVLYKYELINCPSSNAGRGRLLSSEMGLRGCWAGAAGGARGPGLWEQPFTRGTHLVTGFKGIKLSWSSKVKVLGLAPLQSTLIEGQERHLSWHTMAHHGLV